MRAQPRGQRRRYERSVERARRVGVEAGLRIALEAVGVQELVTVGPQRVFAAANG